MLFLNVICFLKNAFKISKDENVKALMYMCKKLP